VTHMNYAQALDFFSIISTSMD